MLSPLIAGTIPKNTQISIYEVRSVGYNIPAHRIFYWGASSDEAYRKQLSHQIDKLITKLETVRRHLDRDIQESPVDSLRKQLGGCCD